MVVIGDGLTLKDQVHAQLLKPVAQFDILPPVFLKTFIESPCFPEEGPVNGKIAGVEEVERDLLGILDQ